MGKKRRDGRAASRRGNSASSNAEARNSGGGALRCTSTGAGGIRYTNGTYVGDLKDGRPHGKGKMELDCGEVYVGEYANGVRHGWGKLTWADGSVYDGEWKGGTRNGTGIMKQVIDDVYDGEWVDGVRQSPTGSVEVYDGEWRDDQKHGRGVCRYASGDTYDGEYKDDERHGWGAYRWEDGKFYEGEMKNNIRQGRGKMTWPSGHWHMQSYEGQWLDEMAHGNGTMTYSSGDVYEGGFVDGKRHGRGTMKYPSGNVHEGDWKDNVMTVKCSSGEICEGVWKDGTFTANADDTAPVAGREIFGGGRKLRSQRSQQRRLEAVKKMACEHCGVDDYQYKLRVCSGCNLALYCSEACQKAASRSHRRICDISLQLPSRDSDRLVLEYDKDKLVDLDTGLRYATKYMANLKHLKIGVKADAGDPLKLSAKQLVSLLKSKKGELDSLFWVGYIIRGGDIRGISNNGDKVWRELHGLKQLRLECMKFDEIQSLRDIVCQQKDSLKVLSLQLVDIGWSKAKNRRTIVQAVASCKHLVKLDLEQCSMTDSDLKVMLQDLPNLRILNLRPVGGKDTAGGHGFTDNTCGLIARKCPALQDLNLRNHNQLTVRGIRKIFECCSHLRSFCTTARKLSCEDVQSLLEIAPQLMLLALEDETDPGQLDQIIEATGGRTVLWVGAGRHEPQGGVSSKAREKNDHQMNALNRILRPFDPEVVNYWDGLDDETR